MGCVFGRVSETVYGRSSIEFLADLVFHLEGVVDIGVSGRIDSVMGGIRGGLELVPDAPVSSFTLKMQGGKKGLIVNSRNLCAGKHRAKARFTGQNGKLANLKPPVRATGCKKPKKAKRSNRRGKAERGARRRRGVRQHQTARPRLGGWAIRQAPRAFALSARVALGNRLNITLTKNVTELPLGDRRR